MEVFFLLLVALAIAPAIAKAQNYSLTYKGYDCTVDCSGHKAGYAWAEKKGVTSYDECGGSSQSFIEGCHSWVDSLNADSGHSPDPDEDRPDDETEDPDL